MLYLSCQRYKSKAIHNYCVALMNLPLAVFIMSKIQIESNSQRVASTSPTVNRCIYHVKDTNRKQFTTGLPFCRHAILLYLSCQRYKSKAIHNYPLQGYYFIHAVFIMSKIQIESNSQQFLQRGSHTPSCIYHVKDTNRKQFTTPGWPLPVCAALYLSCQRYKSKAIHNKAFLFRNCDRAVFIMSKIQIESNSQQFV